MKFDDDIEEDYKNEILRIQNDIDKLLKDFNNSEDMNDMSKNFESKDELATMTKEVDLDNVFSEKFSNPVVAEPVISESKEISSGFVNKGFDYEAIKLEIDKKNRQSFTKTLIIVSLVCILSSSFISFLIVFGIPFTNNLILDSRNSDGIKEFHIEDDATKDESITAFNDDLEKEPDVVNADINNDGKLNQLDVSNHFIELINRVEPSIVGLEVTVPFEEGFLDGIEKGEAEGVNEASGTGIIFSEDDEKIYIITNAHVIQGAKAVNVSVENHEPISAKFVVSDVAEDLAVISVLKEDLSKIGLNDLEIAKFGNSDEVQVGEMVLAIGNALGEGNTATAGIISAKEQEIKIDDKMLTVLQTNAAINPGNSGGPLINMKGEVIGINTAKVSYQYNVEGMGYSITSNSAKSALEGFMNRIDKPFLGISGYDITEEVADSYGLPQLGIFVESTVPGSSADKAGIKRGDIIVSFSGEIVLSMEQLTELISASQVGASVKIGLVRNDKPLTLDATLLEYEDMEF